MKREATAKTVTVSSKGQIVIPAKVREEMGIHEGDKFVLKSLDGKLQLEPLGHVLKRKHPSFMKRLDSIAESIARDWPENVDAVTAIREERDE